MRPSCLRASARKSNPTLEYAISAPALRRKFVVTDGMDILSIVEEGSVSTLTNFKSDVVNREAFGTFSVKVSVFEKRWTDGMKQARTTSTQRHLPSHPVLGLSVAVGEFSLPLVNVVVLAFSLHKKK